MAYSSPTQDFVALSDLHPNLARPVSLLFSNEIVDDCIILLQIYVIHVCLEANSISIIVSSKVPSLLCAQTSNRKIAAAVVRSVGMSPL